MQTFSNYKFLIEPIHLAINIDIKLKVTMNKYTFNP